MSILQFDWIVAFPIIERQRSYFLLESWTTYMINSSNSGPVSNMLGNATTQEILSWLIKSHPVSLSVYIYIFANARKSSSSIRSVTNRPIELINHIHIGISTRCLCVILSAASTFFAVYRLQVHAACNRTGFEKDLLRSSWFLSSTFRICHSTN